MKIFGREPAVVVGVLQAAIVLLGNQLFDWNQDQILAVSAIVVVVGDGFVAWATKDTLLGVGIGGIKALAAAAAVFGHGVPADLVTQLIALTMTLPALYQRTQTFPIADPPKALPGSVSVSDVGTQ